MSARGHRAGVNVDGYLAGYTAMNAAAAQTMLAFVNAQAARIERVWVSYSTTQRSSGGCGGSIVAPEANNDYWNVIKDAVLVDGRPARAVILNAPGHCGHFDVTVRKAPQ